MRASRSVTVTLLSALMLSSCCYGMYHRKRDRTWYDSTGHVMVEKYKTDAQGNLLRDSAGRTIPDPDIPRDRYGNSWVFVNGAWEPQAPPPSSSRSSSSRSGLLLFGSSSGYRSYSSGTSSSSFGGSSSSSSSISRGGFGSTGSGSSSS